MVVGRILAITSLKTWKIRTLIGDIKDIYLWATNGTLEISYNCLFSFIIIDLTKAKNDVKLVEWNASSCESLSVFVGAKYSSDFVEISLYAGCDDKVIDMQTYLMTLACTTKKMIIDQLHAAT